MAREQALREDDPEDIRGGHHHGDGSERRKAGRIRHAAELLESAPDQSLQNSDTEIFPQTHTKRRKPLKSPPPPRKECHFCGTTSTPVWRKAGRAKEVVLCNACSLRLRRSERRSYDHLNLHTAPRQDLPQLRQAPGQASGSTLQMPLFTATPAVTRRYNLTNGLPAALSLSDNKRLADLIFNEKARLLGNPIPTNDNPQRFKTPSHRVPPLPQPRHAPWPTVPYVYERTLGPDPVAPFSPDIADRFLQGGAPPQRHLQTNCSALTASAPGLWNESHTLY